MLNICLCDNDINILNYYSNRISELSEKNNYPHKIENFRSGKDLIFELEQNPNKFNIIIIDIIMKNINGIDIAEMIRGFGYNGIIIFLTSSKEFALDSFKVEPLNYILKNEADYKFDNIFLKAAFKVYKISNKNIVILSKPYSKIINLDTIVYMESLNKKVLLHKVSGEVEKVNCIFREIYKKVKEYGFIRCHKSYVVNSKYVQRFDRFECRVKKYIDIPIGRKYLENFRCEFIEKSVW